MSKNRAVIYTVLFAIVVVSIVTAMIYIKPYGCEVSLLHAFSPFFVGMWVADLIDKFYKHISKKK